MHLEDADADAAHKARQCGGAECDDHPEDPTTGLMDKGGSDKAGHRGDIPDRKIDTAGKHGQCLAAGQDGKDYRLPHGDSGPPRADRPRTRKLDDDNQPDQQKDEWNEGVVAHDVAPCGWLTRRTLVDGSCCGGHLRLRRIWMKLPTINTPMRITPWATSP